MAAIARQAKGATDFGVKWFPRQIQANGSGSSINGSDGGNASIVEKQAAARMLPGVEAKPRKVPVCDHPANGSIEVGVRELNCQTGAMRYQLETS